MEKWRRKRDSNPRVSYPTNGFQDRRLRPLGHSSFSNLPESRPGFQYAQIAGAIPSRRGVSGATVPIIRGFIVEKFQEFCWRLAVITLEILGTLSDRCRRRETLYWQRS
jgi:hypothetical protein